MENPLLDSDKALFFPKKPGYLSEKIENFEELQLPQNFCWNFIHVSCLPMPTKWCLRFFKILLRSWVIDKPGFCECVETRSFLFLQITQDLNKIIPRASFCRHW